MDTGGLCRLPPPLGALLLRESGDLDDDLEWELEEERERDRDRDLDRELNEEAVE